MTQPNRQRHFFPEDEARYMITRPPAVTSIRCVGGPKDGEYIAVNQPAPPVTYVGEIMGALEPSHLRIRTHAYDLTELLTRPGVPAIWVYMYQGAH